MTLFCFATCRSWADQGKFEGLYFETEGRGEPVVLIHGGQMDRRMWDAQFELFSKREKLRQLARENAHCWLNNPLLLRRSKPPAAERLRDIHAPTLIIGGERDVSDIQEIVAKLAAEIVGAKKQTLPGAGHLVPMEKPGEFNRLALDFLAKTDRK